MGRPRYYEEKRAAYTPPKESRRKLILWSLLSALLLILIGAGVGVYFGVFAKGRKGGSTSTPTQSGSPTTPKGAITGGDGTLITMDDGTTFTYSNKFGGYWYDDPNDPLNNGAQAQSYTPALNETFQYGSDKIHGCVSPYSHAT
jgi:glucan 1,3-beta-glucosidase